MTLHTAYARHSSTLVGLTVDAAAERCMRILRYSPAYLAFGFDEYDDSLVAFAWREVLRKRMRLTEAQMQDAQCRADDDRREWMRVWV